MHPDLESLFRDHSGMVFRLCLRYARDREAAEDLTQEVFLKVDVHLSGFRQDSQIATWIYRIAVNVCLDHLRTQRRRRELAETHFNRFVIGNLSAAGEPELARIELERILGEVDPGMRQILFLVLAEGLSNEEAGRIAGKSVAAVAKAISRFRKKMRLRIPLTARVKSWLGREGMS
jgi:RNA polymerase sigma-70 factor (ECF subfamily)